ncbi:DUF488 domain-containing protein [bacterium]|nr:DUF488 domain-containing protein [bacterium]
MYFYTVGHSTRESEEWISLLRYYEIELVVDVRAFPRSRRNPQFNKERLRYFLSPYGIAYKWMGKKLGGYRKKSEGLGENSPNKGWKTEGFRIYADYMLTSKFQEAVRKLIDLGEEKKLALMCAEKLHWKCHRRLISDYLISQGYEVWHIVDQDQHRKHHMTKFAMIKNGTLTYPPPQSDFKDFS